MNKFVVNIKRIECYLLLGLCGSIAACGGKQVVTLDDSAEYHAAKSLPPLKKPSSLTPAASAEVGVAMADDQGKPLAAEDLASLKRPNRKDTSQVSAATEEISREMAAIIPTNKHDAIIARVIESEEDVVRLQIDGGFETAWSYVSSNLRKSDITVHNRNRSAGRFAIGCGKLADSPTVIKHGGWSIFSRKPERQEYCAIQLLANKSVTLVTLNNRDGGEIAAESAKQVFTRLLNN